VAKVGTSNPDRTISLEAAVRKLIIIIIIIIIIRRGSADVPLMGLRVRIPLGIWMSVSCECCQVQVSASDSSRGVLPSVMCLCDREASIVRGPWPTGGCCAIKK